MDFTLTDCCNCGNVTHFCHARANVSGQSVFLVHFISSELSSAFGDSGAGKLRHSGAGLLTC